MFGMNSGYSSLAEACGEVEPKPLCFTPGEDFDPTEEDDVAAVGLAMDRDRADRDRVLIRKLTDENWELKVRLTMAENDMSRDEAIELLQEPVSYGFDDGFLED